MNIRDSLTLIFVPFFHQDPCITPWEINENVNKHITEIKFLDPFLNLDPHQKVMGCILRWDPSSIQVWLKYCSILFCEIMATNQHSSKRTRVKMWPQSGEIILMQYCTLSWNFFVLWGKSPFPLYVNTCVLLLKGAICKKPWPLCAKKKCQCLYVSKKS